MQVDKAELLRGVGGRVENVELVVDETRAAPEQEGRQQGKR